MTQSKIAIREAGHILCTYLAGWAVNGISINSSSENPIVSDYDFGDDEELFDCLQELHLFKQITDEERDNIKEELQRRLVVLLGGPIAANLEKLNEGCCVDCLASDKDENWKMVHCLEKMYTKILNHDIKVQDTSASLRQVINQKWFWETVSSLSEAINQSETKNISQDHIESILRKRNFFFNLRKEKLEVIEGTPLYSWVD